MEAGHSAFEESQFDSIDNDLNGQIEYSKNSCSIIDKRPNHFDQRYKTVNLSDNSDQVTAIAQTAEGAMEASRAKKTAKPGHQTTATTIKHKGEDRMQVDEDNGQRMSQQCRDGSCLEMVDYDLIVPKEFQAINFR